MFALITFQGVGGAHVYSTWTHRPIPIFSHQWGVERTEAKKLKYNQTHTCNNNAIRHDDHHSVHSNHVILSSLLQAVVNQLL